MKQKEDRLKVYYNSGCPVCKAGIQVQKGKSAECEIEWSDVHLDNSLVMELNKDIKAVRKYLHVTDNNGRDHVGINAFIQIWSRTSNEHWKARLFSVPIIKQLAQLSYYIFANGLYRWNRWIKNW